MENTIILDWILSRTLEYLSFLIPAVHIIESIADFDLRGEYEALEVKIEPNTPFYPIIKLAYFYHILRPAGLGIGSQVIVQFTAAQHIYPEVPDTVRTEFDLQWKSNNYGFNFFLHFVTVVQILVSEFIIYNPFSKIERWIESCFKPRW